MQAAYTRKHGLKSVIEVGERPNPKPGADELLIEVHSASINPLDWKIFNSIRYLPLQNVIFGHDVSGVVKTVGSRVKNFKEGDEVYACLRAPQGGGYAEYVTCSEKVVARKPSNLSFAEAAAVPLSALTAWQGLHMGEIREGSLVVVNGASGGVGTFAVQIAKALGATVIGVCSEQNQSMVMQLGAKQTIAYDKECFYEKLMGCDMVFDTVGNVSLKECGTMLKSDGIFVTTIPNVHAVLDITRTTLPGPQSHTPKARMVFIQPSGKNLAEITELIEQGKIKPVVNKHFGLSQIEEAFDQSKTHHTQGKLVIDIRE